MPSPVGAGPPGTSAVQTCLAELSMEIEGDFPTWQRVGRERPGTAAFHGDHVFNEDRNSEVSVRKEDNGSAAISDHSHSFDDDLQAAVDFFKLPPPLLSPVPSPPLAAFAHLGPLPSSLAPVSLHFGLKLLIGHVVCPSMLAVSKEHLWCSDQILFRVT